MSFVGVRVDELRDLETAKQVAVLLDRENARLHERIRTLIGELAKLRGEDGQKQLQLELLKLQEQTVLLQQKLFGASSEKRTGDGDGNGEKPAREKRPGHGPRTQAELPIEPVRHELDAADQICATCGDPLCEWTDQTEDSDEITVVERTFLIHHHQRQKYRCKKGCAPVTAPPPPKLMEGGRYSIEFAIHIAVCKYLDHLPLERQVRIFEREGLRIDSQTLWDQLWALYQLLKASYDALRGEVFKKCLIHADETPWYMLKKGPTKTWYAWSIACIDAVYHRIQPSRSAVEAAMMLEGYQGVVLVDGYKAYQTVARAGPAFILAYCWAHVRRKLMDAEKFEPAATTAINMIAELYDVERDLPDPHGLDGEDLARALDERRRARVEHSAPIVDRIFAWAAQQKARPRGKFDEALGYLQGLKAGLVRFLENPWIPLDNNLGERGLRGLVVGRKNHYGSKSLRGTEVAAAFYSLIETARLRGEDPATYLKRAVLAALANPGTVTVPGTPD
jgi:transposase